MDTNEKLDMILAGQEKIQETLDQILEQQEQTREALSDFGLATNGYQVITPED